MLDQKKLLKQMMDFNKATFDNTFNALTLLQEQAERMTQTVVDQAAWLPEEGKKAVSDWVGAYKKGREDFKNHVDEQYKKVEAFFDA